MCNIGVWGAREASGGFYSVGIYPLHRSVVKPLPIVNAKGYKTPIQRPE